MLQIRHKKYGLYQGRWLGMDFWYPMSEMPEQGICKFESVQDAQDFIKQYDNSNYTEQKDFSIEIFDEGLNRHLIFLGRRQHPDLCLELQN